jgi:hypothetical protein
MVTISITVSTDMDACSLRLSLVGENERVSLSIAGKRTKMPFRLGKHRRIAKVANGDMVVVDRTIARRR